MKISLIAVCLCSITFDLGQLARKSKKNRVSQVEVQASFPR